MPQTSDVIITEGGILVTAPAGKAFDTAAPGPTSTTPPTAGVSPVALTYGGGIPVDRPPTNDELRFRDVMPPGI